MKEKMKMKGGIPPPSPSPYTIEEVIVAQILINDLKYANKTHCHPAPPRAVTADDHDPISWSDISTIKWGCKRKRSAVNHDHHPPPPSIPTPNLNIPPPDHDHAVPPSMMSSFSSMMCLPQGPPPLVSMEEKEQETAVIHRGVPLHPPKKKPRLCMPDGYPAAEANQPCRPSMLIRPKLTTALTSLTHPSNDT